MWLFLSLHTHLISNAVCALFAGMWLFLSNFYPSDRLTLPYTIIDLAISLSHVIAAPLAALCLSLAGKGGLQGWQWLFLLEGTPTLLLAVVMYCRLPNSPEEGQRRFCWQRASYGEVHGQAPVHNEVVWLTFLKRLASSDPCSLLPQLRRENLPGVPADRQEIAASPSSQ